MESRQPTINDEEIGCGTHRRFDPLDADLIFQGDRQTCRAVSP